MASSMWGLICEILWGRTSKDCSERCNTFKEYENEENKHLQPPNTITSPSFHPYTIATILLTTTFTTTMKIKRMLILMSSCSEDGIEVTFAVRAPDVFSGRSKKLMSCRKMFANISDLCGGGLS